MLTQCGVPAAGRPPSSELCAVNENPSSAVRGGASLIVAAQATWAARFRLTEAPGRMAACDGWRARIRNTVR